MLLYAGRSWNCSQLFSRMSFSDGASSSLTKVQVTVSPNPIVTDVTSTPGSSSHVNDVSVYPSGPDSDRSDIPAWFVTSTPATEPVTDASPASPSSMYKVQADGSAVPPLSVVTLLASFKDGASSSLTNVQVMLSPNPMVTDVFGCPAYPSLADLPEPPTIVNIDIRDLPRAPAWQPGDPIKEIPRRFFPPKEEIMTPYESNPDPLADLQRATAMRSTDAFTTPILNQAGQGYTGVNPPDTVGDIGPNHYIQAINNSAAPPE